MRKIDKLLEKYANIPDERFFKDIFDHGEYKAVREVYPVVMDIGALAGEFSAYIYDLAKEIYAIEPYSEHFKELKENIKDFELTKIKPFNIALAGHNGTGKLAVALRGSHKLDEEGVEVETQTLATFMKNNDISHIDLLKIDIEGGEIVFFNSPDFKDVVGEIDVIIGEHFSGLLELMQNYGYNMTVDGNNYIFKR